MRTDVISETLGGLISLASRAHPATAAGSPLTERELARELSRWVPEGKGSEVIAQALMHDRGFGGVTGRGFYRIFADSEQATPLAPSFVVASRAAALERRGQRAAAELLYRISFASGETDPRTDAAIERQTTALLDPTPGRPGGLSVEVAVRGRDAGSSLRRLRDTGAVRAFLEQEAGSRITLSDLVGLLDIASPRIPLTGIELHGHRVGPMVYSMEVVGVYGGHRALWYGMDLGVTAGSPEILLQNIRVDKRLQGLGIGARGLLATSLFALRHGIEGWRGAAHNDGRKVWLRLGGEAMNEGPMAPNADVVWVKFETDHVLATLLDTYFPERILRAWMAGNYSERTRGADPRDWLLAQEGFREAYQQGLREAATIGRLRQEQAALRQREAVVPIALPAAVTASPLQPLPLAPAALLVVGGMAFRPVR